jgi:LysR family nitrogen assimilation transcriptional regulator
MPLHLEDAARLPLILPAIPNAMRSALDRALAAGNIVPNVVAEANVMSAILTAVNAGLGHAIIPKGDFSDVPGFDGMKVLPIEPPIRLTASVLASSSTPLTGAGEAVRDLLVTFARRRFRESPPPGAEWIGD